MWIKRRRRRSQSTTFGWDQHGLPMVEHQQMEEWEEEIHFVDQIQPPKQKDRNTFYNHFLTTGGTILLGLATNSLYDTITSWEGWISFKQKTATLMAAAPDYMVDVWRNLHVVLESLL
jgi:hypothetical protein